MIRYKLNGRYVDSLPASSLDESRLADMLAARQAPGGQTDTSFFAGHDQTVGKLIEKDPTFGQALKRAVAQGYKPNPNDVYLPALANNVGDPAAFVPATGGKGHIKKVCESRNWNCEGTVSVRARELPPPTAPLLAESIVQEKLREKVKANPDLARKDKAELRSEIIAKHGRKKAIT